MYILIQLNQGLMDQKKGWGPLTGGMEVGRVGSEKKINRFNGSIRCVFGVPLY